MQRWETILNRTGICIGAATIAWGIMRFIGEGAVVPLLIALAIIIGGPVEDKLTEWAEKKGRTGKERQAYAHLVDLATSVGFLICLGLASVLA